MLLQVLLYSFLCFANYAIATDSYPACAMYQPSEILNQGGFNRYIYEIPYDVHLADTPGLLIANIQRTITGRIRLSNLYDIGFNVSVPSGEVYTGNLQGQEGVLLSHMVVVFGATLVVPETGEYTFSLDGASDAASVFILDNLDTYCCENLADTFLLGLSEYSNIYYIPSDPKYQTTSMTVNLVAGISYSLFFSYINYDGDAIFKPTMTTPSGEIITNFKGYIYYSKDSVCKTGNSTSSVVSQWSETYVTTTSTTTITKVGTVTEEDLPYTEIETVYYVMTPAPTSASSSVVSSSSKAAISTSFSSSSLSESTLSSSSVILSSSEQTSAVSSQQSSAISSSVSLSSVMSSLTPSSTIPPFTSSSTIPPFTSSSAIPETALSANKTERVSSTVSDAVTSSVVSSSEEASVSSFTQSSKISSSVYTVLSNLDGDSLTKQLTTSTTSSAFNNFTSGSATSTSGFATRTLLSSSSNANKFSNSSITEGSTRSSTSYPSTKSTQSDLHGESSGDAGQFGSEDYLTTSTYTDVYGMTRTTTVRCSTQSNDIKPTGESHMSDVTVVTVTSCSNKKCETVVSTMAHPTDLVKTTVTGKLDQQGTTTSSGYSGASSVASVAVQLQSSRGSSSATHTVQQAPNAAGKYTVGLLFSIVPIAFPLFFM